MDKLVIYSSGFVNRTVELTGQNIRIGRAKGNDVVLFDPAQVVSRFHAELRYEDGRYILLDLNSANGTWVFDHRIQRIVFETGTVAEIGDYRFVIEADTEATTAPPRSRSDLEARHAPGPKTPSGTLVISVLPTLAEPVAPASLPPEPAPPTRVPPPRVASPPSFPPAPVPPPAVVAVPTMPAPPVPAPRVETPIPPAAPGSIPSVTAAPPARLSTSQPRAPAADSSRDERRVGSQGAARSISAKGGGSSLSAPLARQPRALVVSAFALVILVVGVIGMIIGWEYLPSSRDDAKRPADNQLRARQSGAATPTKPPAVPAAATSAGPPTTTPSVTPAPPATPQPPVVPVQPAAQAPRPAARTADRASPPPPTPVPGRLDQSTVPAGVNRRSGESQSDFLMRAQRLQGTYDEARAALQARDFAAAVALFTRLESEQPGFLDVPLRLAESRDGLRESKRAAAQAALVTAGAAERRGDLVEAQKEYERALEADPACGADEALRRVRGQMKTLGDAAFQRARTFDAMGRSEDAIAQYERAVQLLPPDDPNRKVAKARLDVLRASFIKQPSR